MSNIQSFAFIVLLLAILPPTHVSAHQRLLKRFDRDGDGRLSVSERAEMRETIGRLRDLRGNGNRKARHGQIDPDNSNLYKVVQGQYSVQSSDLVLADKDRQLQLEIRVSFPVTDSDRQLPTIIFSHGAGGSKDAYQPLIAHWVSYGYVCVQPTHGDSLSRLSSKDRRKFKSLLEYVNSGELYKHQLTRPEDVALVLDSLDAIESQIPKLTQRIDRQSIGVGGHSFGAHTASMVAGMSLKNLPPAPRTVMRDDRPAAFLMISPQGTGGRVDDLSWSAIDRPAMVVTGSEDRGRNGQSHEWRLEAFEHLPAGDKYLTFISGAQHTFGGISGRRTGGGGQTNPDHVYYVKSSTLAFWDAYLRHDVVAKKYLDSDELKQLTSEMARVEKKTQ